MGVHPDESTRAPWCYGWRSAPPAQRPFLFVNPRSGGGKAARAGLVEHARERGIETLVLQTGESIEKLIEQALAGGADALGVAGGDGSLAVVAAAAVAGDLPFVCIPAGTRNHFARDLGVERGDLLGALNAFHDGVERRIDVGEVNGRIFLNNVSLGLYGEAVRNPAYREASMRVLLETAGHVLGPSAEAPPLRLVDDRGLAHTGPILVLISNNPYALQPAVTGTRERLDSGLLGILVVDPVEFGAPLLAHTWTAAEVDVSASTPLHAGIDGEAVDLAADLHVVIRPAALRARISSRHPGVSPSGRLGHTSSASAAFSRSHDAYLRAHSTSHQAISMLLAVR